MSLPVPLRVSTKLALGFLVIALAGCKKSSGDATPAPAASASASASAGVSAAPSAFDAGPNAPLPPPGMQSIPERFASEARSRPTGTVRVEQVIAAIQGAGATIREQRQHLGAPFLAAYCMGGQTGEDVHFSICEYNDPARATEGKAMSDKAFGTVPNRTLYQNGATTLTLRVGGSSPGDKDLAKKLADAFAKLQPAK